MDRLTRSSLNHLADETEKEYGKLVQKLLALALLEAGANALIERSIQGIDLEFDLAGQTYGLEVKTSTSQAVRLSAKDVSGLDRLVEQGMEVRLAVLLGGPLEDWIMAGYYPKEFAPGKDYTSFRLRPYRDPELEVRIARPFAEVVERHLQTAVTQRQGGLDRILASYEQWRRP